LPTPPNNTSTGHTYATHTLAGQKLLLLPQRAIYWPAQKALLLADVHLGKAAHFRKAGIPVARQVHLKDLEKLKSLITSHDTQQVIVLGDLFHSHLNNEWQDFLDFLDQWPGITFHLVEGNHDILPPSAYAHPHLVLHKESWYLPPFYLSHEPMPSPPQGYNLAGHLHPGATLKGAGKQRLTLPCFWFRPTHGVLPAFGSFTGLAKVGVKPNDQLFVLTNNGVFEK